MTTDQQSERAVLKWDVDEPFVLPIRYSTGRTVNASMCDIWSGEVHVGWTYSEAAAKQIVSPVNERPDLLARIERLEEALRKARVSIATWSPDPTEPLDEIDAALSE